MFGTPILFLIFNRPDTSRQIFEKIRALKPKYLYIGADGPRPHVSDDIELCRQTRDIVAAIDWDCEVKTHFNDKNLGCGLAPAIAISWFFDHVEDGIILEDDCIPNDSFFYYCETLLNKYRHTPQVMMVCGTSYQSEPLNNDTYYFSKYPHVWGWASWKRAWELYSFKLDDESEQTRSDVIKKTFPSSREKKFWIRNIQMIINGLDAWDYQLMYWMWKNNALCITPWKNMISNIGFGSHATHTLNAHSTQSQMMQYEVTDIEHPAKITVNKKADRYERYTILIDSNARVITNKFRAVNSRLHSILRLYNGK